MKTRQQQCQVSMPHVNDNHDDNNHTVTEMTDEEGFLLINLLHECLPHTEHGMRPSRCFSYTLTHAEHETTNIGVVPCPASFLHPTICRTRNNTPIGVVLWSASFLPLTTCQAQNHTLIGVSLLSDPFLAPRMNFKGCSLIFYIILDYYYIYLIL